MRLVPGLRLLAFVAASTVTVLFASERMYWYFARGPIEQLALLGFYAPAVAAVPYLIHRHRVSNLWGLWLVVPVFAYLVEGAIVPVLYSGGPFVPVFPGLFTFWHGVVGVGLVWLQFRRWLVGGESRRLLLASIGIGAYWGLWATTAVVERNDPDLVAELGGPPDLLDPVGFAVYAALCTAALAAAHWVLGRVWVTRFAPSPPATRLWLLVVAAVVIGWTFVIPWAGPMFAAYAGLQIWALRRMPPSHTPTLLQQLDGPVAMSSLWPLAAIPVAAAGSYGLWWAVDPSPETIESWVFLFASGLQALAGIGLLAVSHWRARAGRRSHRAATAAAMPPPPTGPMLPPPPTAPVRFVPDR